MNFKQWLFEIGGQNGGGDIPKQCPYDPEHPGGDSPQGSAIRANNLDRLINPNKKDNEDSDLPPAPYKYGKDRFRMKKKMKN
jgi:hypothetical protein